MFIIHPIPDLRESIPILYWIKHTNPSYMQITHKCI